MTADELKDFIKQRGLTYAEFAEQIGYGEGAVRVAISSKKVSAQMAKACELIERAEKAEQMNAELKAAFKTINKWIYADNLSEID